MNTNGKFSQYKEAAISKSIKLVTRRPFNYTYHNVWKLAIPADTQMKAVKDNQVDLLNARDC